MSFKTTFFAALAAASLGVSALAEDLQLGALTITSPFARATMPNAPVAGGFLTITNAGPEDDTLIAAVSDIAGTMQVHEMVMDGDVMKMRELAGGLVIPAGGTVELKPGGYHLMFMDLKGALVEGETVKVTLTFANAGTVDVELAIGPRAAMGMGHGN
jgi:periplasmic copper chaperone A